MFVASCFVRPLSFALYVAFIAFVGTDQNAVAIRAHLYQRDSYGSPFYDPTLSETHIIRRAVARSVKRLSLSPTHIGPTADVFGEFGEYFMNIRLGTPPQVDISAVVDTGSGLTWIQCEPCVKCEPGSIFNPKSSKSYSKVRCGPSKPCPAGSFSQCKADGFCHYNIQYATSNVAHSIGLMSTDSMQIDSSLSRPINIPHYMFGCGTDNVPPFAFSAGSGVVGLGAGPQSLVRQLGPISMGRFSYCLTPLGSGVTSHIHFGEDAVVSGPGTITIPLATAKKLGEQEGPYLATLEAFTIGNIRIPFTSSGKEGKIAIDSSMTFIGLPRPYYFQIVDAVINETGAKPYTGPGRIVDLCFNEKDLKSPLPNIVANFKGGDVPLQEKNVFGYLKPHVCLLFGASDSYPVFGSMAQHNFQVGYDTVAGTVSFKPFDCTTA